jgi:hypothetical protein
LAAERLKNSLLGDILQNHSAPKSVICKHFAPPRNVFLGFSLDRHVGRLNVPCFAPRR